MASTVVILIAGTSWNVPGDFNAGDNTVEAIGGGGCGFAGTTGTATQGRPGGAAGGGGAYAKVTN